jgi:uncharacterized protein
MRSATVPLLVFACLAGPAAAQERGTDVAFDERPVARAISRARDEVTRGVAYDADWERIGYPMGDVDQAHGACTDLVVRAMRAAGLDLQRLVHEDVVRAPAAYRTYVTQPDATIDHRRVGPLLVYLRRHARSVPVDNDFAPGDIVVVSFDACPRCGPQHIAVVSDRLGPRGVPLLIHNMGPTAREDDTLDAWTRLGHFRLL